MARPKFYLDIRKSEGDRFPLLLSYSFNGMRLKYYPNITIKESDYVEKYWLSNKRPIKTNALHAPFYNDLLTNIEADAVKFVTSTKGELLNPKYIRDQLDLIYKPKTKNIEPATNKREENSFIRYFEKGIKDSQNGKRLISKSGERYSLSMVKHYGVTLSALRRYLKYIDENDLLFDQIDKEFYESFRDFCYCEEKKQRATFHGYIRNIKTIMNEVGRSDQVKSFTKPTFEADTIYLTLEEIDKIANLDLTDSTKSYRNKKEQNIYYHTLDKVRDLFLIGVYTGLRFSDFSMLDIKSIQDNVIRLKQKKTNDLVTIPIMSKLKTVLEKYNKDFPKISNQKFNDYIKIVGELAGLNDIRSIKNTKGNIINSTNHPLYSLITSHCCRRSYATNMFKAGVSNMLIMSATGHKTETSFLKYIRATNEDKAKLLAQEFKRLGL